jgi:hypothetical protein
MIGKNCYQWERSPTIILSNDSQDSHLDSSIRDSIPIRQHRLEPSKKQGQWSWRKELRNEERFTNKSRRI